MPLGPGKYDDLCTHVREGAKAAAAIVIVVGGDKGHGFSVQANETAALALPALLEQVARELRRSQK